MRGDQSRTVVSINSGSHIIYLQGKDKRCFQRSREETEFVKGGPAQRSTNGSNIFPHPRNIPARRKITRIREPKEKPERDRLPIGPIKPAAARLLP